MAHSYSIHIHILHEVNIVNCQLLTACTPRRWPECVPAHSFENYLLIIYIDSILKSYLNSPESKLLRKLMNCLFPCINTYNNLIKIRELRIPQSGISERSTDYSLP